MQTLVFWIGVVRVPMGQCIAVVNLKVHVSIRIEEQADSDAIEVFALVGMTAAARYDQIARVAGIEKRDEHQPIRFAGMARQEGQMQFGGSDNAFIIDQSVLRIPAYGVDPADNELFHVEQWPITELARGAQHQLDISRPVTPISRRAAEELRHSPQPADVLRLSEPAHELAVGSVAAGVMRGAEHGQAEAESGSERQRIVLGSRRQILSKTNRDHATVSVFHARLNVERLPEQTGVVITDCAGEKKPEFCRRFRPPVRSRGNFNCRTPPDRLSQRDRIAIDLAVDVQI